ncbi:uncharacterized protein LOC143920806 [Arctopsyche grandis]|uniref:uncharacterized protein LOC143920806 n=1 Tax=Arctopsyche grandis TaxID=121162 RepID=UPI00406D832C
MDETVGEDSGEDRLYNGVIVKQELMLDYEHCDETQPSDDAFEESGFPIITCIKSEYSLEGKDQKIEAEIACVKSEDSDFLINKLNNEELLDDCNDSNIKREDYISESDSIQNLNEDELQADDVCFKVEAVESDEIIIAEPVISVQEKLQNYVSQTNDLLSPVSYQCSICHRPFQYFGSLKKHEKLHEAEPKSDSASKLNPSPRPPKSTVKNNGKRLRKPVGAKTHNCWCGSAFRRKSSMIACIKSHGGFLCKWCSLPFRFKRDFNRHEQSMHAEMAKMKEYRCKFCNKGFIHKKVMQNHVDKHITNSVHCEYCDTVFLDRKLLKSHIASEHTATTPQVVAKKPIVVENIAVFKFKCKHCSKSYTTLKALSDHQADDHNKIKKKHQCERCKDCFRNASELSSHRRLHCRGGQYPVVVKTKSVVKETVIVHKCDVCSQIFRSKEMMLRHKAKHPFVEFVEDDSTQKRIFFK